MLDKDKFLTEIAKDTIISEEEIKVRELLELCSHKNMIVDKSIIDKYNYRTFRLAYLELCKNKDDRKIIKDMINGEYLIENLSFLKTDDFNLLNEDDEEIY